MEGCVYCGGPIEDPSPEHVIPRSLGAYDFVIDVCLVCNQRANRWVDAPLVQCTTVQRARANLGMLDERGRPYEVHYVGNVVAAVAVDEDHPIQGDINETFRAGDPVDKPGLMAHVSWNGSELAGEMMGAGHSTLPDGRNVHHIYRHERDEPDDAVYDSDFVPEHFVAVVEASRACPHDPQAWERFAAKAGLGLLGALRTGRIPEATLDDLATTDNQQLVTTRLRALALPGSPPPRRPRACEPKGIDEPPQPVHQVAIADVDGAVVIRVLLFGILDLRTRIDGAQFHHNIETQVPVRLAPAS